MLSERVRRWLAEPVGTCPWCARPVTRMDPRGIDHRGRICHLGCLETGAEGPCPLCGQPIARREQREQTPSGLRHKDCSEAAKRRASGR
jgi:endogenous inhibitor of DNA gyrase (YacG/DUF329 family)